MRKGKIITSILSLIFILALSFILKKYDLQPKPATLAVQDVIVKTNVATNAAVVTRVIDGDTIEIASGEKIRLIGIDTPETVDPRRGVQCFGKAASEYTKSLVLNKQVQLVKDISETDRYGRLLRYIYVDDEFINEKLVREGYAKASSYPPDIKFQSILQDAQTSAQNDNKGLWKECPIK